MEYRLDILKFGNNERIKFSEEKRAVGMVKHRVEDVLFSLTPNRIA